MSDFFIIFFFFWLFLLECVLQLDSWVDFAVESSV